MKTQETSLAAYDEVKPSIAAKQSKVLALLEKRGPFCSQELSLALGWPINTVTPRVYELREMGKVVLAFKDKYRPTGRTVMFWKAANG